MARNPFKPTAGANPPLLVGRDELIAEFSESIEDGPGAPMRLSIFTGPRGVGKTVILNAIADRAQDDYQWLVFHETATPGFLARLMRAIEKALDQKARRSITGVTLPSLLGSGGGGVQVSAAAQERPTDDFREVIAPLLDRCEANGTGVLVTIDEVHTENSTELRQLAIAVQHLIREERQFALAFAGLPTAVDDLLTANQITFLRRADRRDLRDVPLADVGEALNTTINESGRTITAEALELATQATGGYPFMIQPRRLPDLAKRHRQHDHACCRRGRHRGCADPARLPCARPSAPGAFRCRPNVLARDGAGRRSLEDG